MRLSVAMLTVHACLSPLQDIFVYSPALPIGKPYGWAVWAAVGIILSPVLVGLTAFLMSTSGWVGVQGLVHLCPRHEHLQLMRTPSAE